MLEKGLPFGKNKRLRERNETFVHHPTTKDAIQTVLVTTYGLKDNLYSGSIYTTVTMDDLFMPSEI